MGTSVSAQEQLEHVCLVAQKDTLFQLRLQLIWTSSAQTHIFTPSSTKPVCSNYRKEPSLPHALNSGASTLTDTQASAFVFPGRAGALVRAQHSFEPMGRFTSFSQKERELDPLTDCTHIPVAEEKEHGNCAKCALFERKKGWFNGDGKHDLFW